MSISRMKPRCTSVWKSLVMLVPSRLVDPGFLACSHSIFCLAAMWFWGLRLGCGITTSLKSSQGRLDKLLYFGEDFLLANTPGPCNQKWAMKSTNTVCVQRGFRRSEICHCDILLKQEFIMTASGKGINHINNKTQGYYNCDGFKTAKPERACKDQCTRYR